MNPTSLFLFLIDFLQIIIQARKSDAGALKIYVPCACFSGRVKSFYEIPSSIDLVGLY